jgi:glutaredoxin
MLNRWAVPAAVAAILGCFGLGIWLGPIALQLFRGDARASSYAHFDSRPLVERTGRPVILFSTATCGFCVKARALLDARGVDYANLRIDDSEQARTEFAALSAVGVPVLLIGQRRIEGFRKQAIIEALEVLGNNP